METELPSESIHPHIINTAMSANSIRTTGTDLSSPVKMTGVDSNQSASSSVPHVVLPSPTSVVLLDDVVDNNCVSSKNTNEHSPEDEGGTSSSLGNPQQGPTDSGISSGTTTSEEDCTIATATTTTTNATTPSAGRASKIVPPKKHNMPQYHNVGGTSSPQVTPRKAATHRAEGTGSRAAGVTPVTPEAFPSPRRKVRPVTVPQPFLNLSTSNRKKPSYLEQQEEAAAAKAQAEAAQRAKSVRTLTKPQAPKLATEARALARTRTRSRDDEDATSLQSYQSYRSVYSTQTSYGNTQRRPGSYMRPTASSRNRNEQQELSRSPSKDSTLPSSLLRTTSVPSRKRDNIFNSSSTNGPSSPRRTVGLTKPVGPKFLLDAKYGEKKQPVPSPTGGTPSHDDGRTSRRVSLSLSHDLQNDDSQSHTSTSRSQSAHRTLTVPVGPKFRLDAKFGEKHMSTSSSRTLTQV